MAPKTSTALWGPSLPAAAASPWATAFMVQANGGFNAVPARDLAEPMLTVTTTGSQQQFPVAHLITLRQHSTGRDLAEPLATVAAGGEHHALV